MMNRRRFLQSGPLMLGGCLAMGLPSTLRARGLRRLPKAAGAALGSARNLIFIVLEGGPSHIDTFDLKRGAWTPDLLGPELLTNGVDWPSGVMPKLGRMIDRFSILRSLSAQEAVHSRAVYQLLTAHRQSPALADEIPNFVSVAAYFLEAQRRPNDALPTAMVMGFDAIGAGFLPARHKALQMGADGAIPNMAHNRPDADRRFKLLDDQGALQGARGDLRDDFLEFQAGARRLMADTELAALINQPETDAQEHPFVRACRTAARTLEADKGARVLLMSLGNWDHHIGIYDPAAPNGLAGLSAAFDDGFSLLIESLAAAPGAGGGSLLDETLVVAVGEFGRTIGPLNTSMGRDHYPYALPALMAGGGVQPGRVIGATDSAGAYISDPGWSHNRYMLPNDLMATIYSALGVDWTARFEDTPSGRVFEAVDTSLNGPAYPIEELFA